MNSEDVQVLYRYHRWANRRVLDAVAALSEEDRLKDLGVSYRSVDGTLRHIVWGEWRWLARWVAPRDAAGGDPLTAVGQAALLFRWRQIERVQTDFVESLSDDDLKKRITYENPPGTPWTYTLAEMLQHLVLHSTFHRGQVVAMLRQLGAPGIATDFLVHIDEGA
jgi:uncharacterized damage-inducible protein DinB